MIEKEIWDGIKIGDYKAFQNLYSYFFDQLYSYGMKICNDNEQVEDAIHDLFLDIWKYHKKLSPTTSIRFYLYRSIRRKIYKNQDRNIKETVFEKEIETFFEQTGDAHDLRIIEEESKSLIIARLQVGLKELPSRQYDALVLKFFSNFSYEEIGNMLDMNEQSVRNLIQRGLKKLRALLGTGLLIFAAVLIFKHFFLI